MNEQVCPVCQNTNGEHKPGCSRSTPKEWNKPLGRPRTLTGGHSVPVYLSTAHVETASRLGDGNVSAGVRLALEMASKPTTGKE